MVGLNFDKVVLMELTDSMVLFCVKWQEECRTFQPIYNKIYHDLKLSYPKIIVT